MQPPTALILATFGTQTGLALVLGGLLLGFHRVYRRSYLLWWACSWFGFAAYLTAATSNQLGYFNLPLANAWRILVSLAGGVGGYLQIAWLGQGTWELVSSREISRSRSRLLVMVAIALGVVAGLLYAWDSSGATARYLIRVGIRSAVASVAFLACGISIWRMQRQVPGWAKTVLAIAVVLYGLEQFNYFSQVLAVFLGRPMSQELGYYAFLDIVLQFGIGLSMAGLLLDEERVKTIAIAEGKRQAEDQLRARDARYRALIEGALDIIIVADAQGTILYASQAASRVLGLDPDQLAGRNGFDFVHPQDIPVVSGALQRLLADPARPEALEFRFRHADGRWLMLETVGRNRLSDPDIRGIVVNSREVTDRRRAETELADERWRNQLIVEAALDAVVTIDLEGRIRSWNTQAETTFGWTRGEAIGRQIDETIIPPEYREEHRRGLEQFRRTGEGRVLGRRLELTALHRDGHRFSVELAIVPLASGESTLFCAFVRDITERRRLEEQLLHAQKMESVGRLAGGVAHDFNNILTVIAGNASLARHSVPADSPLAVDLEEISRAAERATGLTRQLLSFARRQMVEPRIFDLNDLVGRLEKMLRRLIGEDVALETGLAPEPCLVRADPGQIEQVLVNLAVNARDAMPDGGMLRVLTRRETFTQSRVTPVAGMAAGDYQALAVQDTGTGMDPEVKRHLFEPFFTTKPPGQGTGLGLATCYGIVRQSGGFIGVESDVGRGARFTVYLPQVEAGPGVVVQGRAPVRLEGKETVLVVEDEAPVRKLAVRALQDLGYAVLEAGDGEEALGVVRSHPGRVDCVVTDVIMPRLGGIELARRLREASPTVPILFTSGYTDDFQAVGGADLMPLRAGFLQKPYTPDSLAYRVRELLDAEVPPP